MPTFTLASHTYAPGERATTASVTIPVTLTQARVTLNLTTAQLQDPATDVMGQLEWAPAGTPDVSPLWSLLGSTRLQGNPLNRAGLLPYIDVSATTIRQQQGHLVRGWVQNNGAAPITFDATVILT